MRVNKLLSISLMSLLIMGLMIFTGPRVVTADSQLDYSPGDISGSILSDIVNVTYTNLGSFLGLDSVQKERIIERVVVRAAFDINAAVALMDAHDEMWETMFGVPVFTAVPGTTFTSANVADFADYFDNPDDPKFAATIDKDGNETLNTDSYRAIVDYADFDTTDYDSLNGSEHENLNTQYDDLTTDLLEIDEDEDDWIEESSDLVVAGFNNLEATILEVLKKAVANDASVNVPSSQIRIDNYTLVDAYHEQTMNSALAENIVDSYENAKLGGFVDSFKLSTPLKFSKVALGQKMDTFKKASGAISESASKTFDTVKGSTAFTNVLAFKNSIVKGSISRITGAKEKVRAAFSKITDGFSSLKSGTQKLASKAMGWYSGLATKAQSIVKWVVVLLIIAIVLYVIFYLKRMQLMTRF